MDASIDAAARALAAGDSLTALKYVALREEPAALALRGIAMAQLGEYPRSRDLLRRAARRFGPRAALARARCLVAEAEVALALREFGGSPRTLSAAAATLAAHGDHANALQAHLILIRRLMLLGRLDDAARALRDIDGRGLGPVQAAIAALLEAEIALRDLRIDAARAALARAEAASRAAAVPALRTEAEELGAALTRPAARIVRGGEARMAVLDEVAALLASDTWVLDGCRLRLRSAGGWLSLARRPVLFAIATALAQAWPGDVDRQRLIATVFRTAHADDSHRARLRVEMGRLRALLRPAADIIATDDGYALEVQHHPAVAVVAPPMAGERGSLVALLADGAPWSTSALALALGASQRNVQRALAALEAEGRVRAIGRARGRRWLAAPLAPFTPILLLPSAPPST